MNFEKFYALVDKYELLVSIDAAEVEAVKGRTHMHALKLSPGDNDATRLIYGDVDVYIEAFLKDDNTFLVQCGLYLDSPNPDRVKASQNPVMRRLLESIDKKINFGEISVNTIDEVLGLFEEQLKYKK